MRQVNLAGVPYKIVGDIVKRAVTPWAAKIASGDREYSDFSQASFEEYHDFRNGIGLESAISGKSSMLWWSEGVDFSTARSAVLGPLVNTAEYDTWEASHDYSLLNFVIPTTPNGYCYECTTDAGSSDATEPTWPTTVGLTVVDDGITWTCRAYLAPIKIIDFKGGDSAKKTYIIQNSRILKWDGTNLDCVENTFASPIDAIVVTDATDEYLIVSSAASAIYTTDGATWTALIWWKTPDSHSDPDTEWDNEENAYDGSTSNYAVSTDDGYLELILTAPLYSDRVRVYLPDLGSDDIDIDFYYDGAWTNIHTGVIAEGEWVTEINSAGIKKVEKVRVKRGAAAELRLAELEIGIFPYGPMADYGNRIYSILSSGQAVISSAVKDIDAIGGAFDLTGNYGTVYDFFEGKLLSDGSPILYFCGNEGLFSLDLTNELAYKQEVSYPPLTYAGHVGKYWNANVWVATGYGILKIAPTMATEIGPDQDDGLPSGYQGYIYDMVSVGNWLVYCVNGGSSDKSSILKRNASLGGNLQVYTTSAVDKAIACLHHSPSSLYANGRLWFGEDTTVKYMMFPDTTSNVKQIATYEYVNDSDYAKLPVFRKLAAISKTALGVAAITKSCDDSEYVSLYYGLNGAAPTTSLGYFKDSPRATILTFPSTGGGLGEVFYTIQLAFKLIRGGTDTNSPELESLLFYYLPTPTVINGWSFRIEATEDDSEEIIEAFETIRDTNTLVVFYPTGDTAKTSYNVKLTTMPLKFYAEEQGAREGWIQVDVQEIFKG